MKNMLLAAALVLTSTYALAKDYQVTGSVVEVTDTKIVVDKKGEKFEIARTADSKMTTAPEVGGNATVYYTMTATKIEAKAKAAAKKKK